MKSNSFWVANSFRAKGVSTLMPTILASRPSRFESLSRTVHISSVHTEASAPGKNVRTAS